MPRDFHHADLMRSFAAFNTTAIGSMTGTRFLSVANLRAHARHRLAARWFRLVVS